MVGYVAWLAMIMVWFSSDEGKQGARLVFLFVSTKMAMESVRNVVTLFVPGKHALATDGLERPFMAGDYCCLSSI